VPCPWATEEPWASSVGFAGAQRRPEPSTAESRHPLLPRVCRLHKPPSHRWLYLGLHRRPCRFQVSKALFPGERSRFGTRLGSALALHWYTLRTSLHPACQAAAGGPSLALCVHKADDDDSDGCDLRAAAETDDAVKAAAAQVLRAQLETQSTELMHGLRSSAGSGLYKSGRALCRAGAARRS